VTPPAPWLRWLGVLLLALLGALIGVLGAFVQAERALIDVPWGVLTVPWGVILVWAALIAAIRGGAWAIATRWGSWAVLAGWIGATIAMSAESGSGDLALSGGGRQLTYLMVGVIAGSTAASLPLPRASKGEGNGRIA
jgi:sulfite exporter TauE/SafE